MLQLCVNCNMLLDVQRAWVEFKIRADPVPTNAGSQDTRAKADKGRARGTTRLLLLDDTSDMYNTKRRDGAEVKLGWVGMHAGVGW